MQVVSDADLGGCGLDRKSTTVGCEFLDGKLVQKGIQETNVCFVVNN